MNRRQIAHLSAADRLALKSEARLNGCIEWTGVNNCGYGQTSINAKHVLVHRLAFELGVADHRLLTDADLPPIDEARLQAAIAAVCAMPLDEFFAACRAVGRPVQTHRDVLARWNRHADKVAS